MNTSLAVLLDFEMIFRVGCDCPIDFSARTYEEGAILEREKRRRRREREREREDGKEASAVLPPNQE